MYAATTSIEAFDNELFAAIVDEARRQEEHIELIASENYASPRVMEAQGSVLTNKYAEGYPGKRYYGGCEYVDVAEQLAIDRAKKLFGADYANVQPHSGSQANAAAFFALLEPGDPILPLVDASACQALSRAGDQGVDPGPAPRRRGATLGAARGLQGTPRAYRPATRSPQASRGRLIHPPPITRAMRTAFRRISRLADRRNVC